MIAQYHCLSFLVTYLPLCGILVLCYFSNLSYFAFRFYFFHFVAISPLAAPERPLQLCLQRCGALLARRCRYERNGRCEAWTCETHFDNFFAQTIDRSATTQLVSTVSHLRFATFVDPSLDFEEKSGSTRQKFRPRVRSTSSTSLSSHHLKSRTRTRSRNVRIATQPLMSNSCSKS